MFFLGIVVLLLSGCIIPGFTISFEAILPGYHTGPTATPKVYPTRTPLPWPTVTLHPTVTPYPTDAPFRSDYEPRLMSTRQVVENGYFSFLPVQYYNVSVESNSLIMDDNINSIYIYMEGFQNDFFSSNHPERMAQSILDNLNEDQDYQFSFTGNVDTLLVDGAEGQVYEVTGTYAGYNYKGAIIVFTLGDDLFVSGTCFTLTEYDMTLWKNKGHKDLLAFLNSMEFFKTSLDSQNY